ncbi:nitrate reductase molybdenum cofactor assembly chaperone [Streptomyces sp. ODS28]|uniref:nitrate reductase molybdenum cofactor assembly chaperone n=1 Tax=Streptomyces sp. ODS28 TaxID=3136688 RepID=UPI0031E7F680
MNRPLIHQASSLLLSYPGPEWPQRLHTVREALRGLPGTEVALLTGFCERVTGTDTLALAADYVHAFDRSRRRTLHLTYYTDGDTRRRGASLARLKSLYRQHGWQPAGEELPDFLPVMLEFAARTPKEGLRLLSEHRAGVELLRYALEEHHGPYADILRAVCATLPGPSPAGREEARALARTGPPVETVGLDAFPARPTAARGPSTLAPDAQEERR